MGVAFDYIYLAAFIPILAVLLIFTYQQIQSQQHMLAGLWRQKQFNEQRNIKFILSVFFYVGALAFIIFAMIGVEGKYTDKNRTVNGSEVVFLVDISNSMLARKQSETRLTLVKDFINDIYMRQRQGHFALVAYKGTALTMLPITEDINALRQATDILAPLLITAAGSNISSGLETAIQRFTRNRDRHKVLILLSDGEDRDFSIESIDYFNKFRDIEFYAIGVGSKEGAFITLPDGQRLLNQNGRQVVSRLREDILGEIAAAANGGYINLDDREQISALAQKLKTYSESGETRITGNEKVVYFRVQLLLALVLFFMAGLINILPWPKKKYETFSNDENI